MVSSPSSSRLLCSARLPSFSSSSSWLRSTPPSPFNLSFPRQTKPIPLAVSRRSGTMTLGCSRDFGFNSDDDVEKFRSKREALAKLTRGVQPLDISLIEEDVEPETVDAMKMSISKMLGIELLPSDNFKVQIESPWQHLSDLLITFMMAGYGLKNVERKLYLEENFEMDDDEEEEEDRTTIRYFEDLPEKTQQQVKLQLQSRLLALEKELSEKSRILDRRAV